VLKSVDPVGLQAQFKVNSQADAKAVSAESEGARIGQESGWEAIQHATRMGEAYDARDMMYRNSRLPAYQIESQYRERVGQEYDRHSAVAAQIGAQAEASLSRYGTAGEVAAWQEGVLRGESDALAAWKARETVVTELKWAVASAALGTIGRAIAVARAERAAKEGLGAAVHEWSRMKLALASSKERRMFNTATVVHDMRSGRYYFGMNKGVTYSGVPLHRTIADRLPKVSRNKYELGNCAEVDAVNQALTDGAQWSNLEMHTIGIRKDGSTFVKQLCENCLETFGGISVR
jgi:hypothetical protein